MITCSGEIIQDEEDHLYSESNKLNKATSIKDFMTELRGMNRKK